MGSADRVAEAFSTLKERLASLDGIIDTDTLDLRAKADRYERWREGTGRWLRQSFVKEASKFYSRTRERRRSDSFFDGDIAFLDGAADARAFLVALQGTLQESPADLLSPSAKRVSVPGTPERGRTVFVVHGRNEKARVELFNFLRALKLEPLEWPEVLALTGQGSPYIGQGLDRALDEAAAFVVLFTGDELTTLRKEFWSQQGDDKTREQSRPNVLFEAGMAFGRDPARTIIVQVGPVSSFSDNVGRYTIRLDNTPLKRKALVDALKRVGCNLDTTADDWLTQYDFESVVPAAPTPQASTLPAETPTSESPAVPTKENAEALTSDSLSKNALQILQWLGQSGQNIATSEVAAALSVTPGQAQHLLEDLEARGFVEAVHFWTGSETSYYATRACRALLAKLGCL